jgi:hypothetical protein
VWWPQLNLSSATADLSGCRHFSHRSGQVSVELRIYSDLNPEQTFDMAMKLDLVETGGL